MSFVTHHEKVYRNLAKKYSVAAVKLGEIVGLIDDDIFMCDLIWEDWLPSDVGETPMQIMDRISVLFEKGYRMFALIKLIWVSLSISINIENMPTEVLLTIFSFVDPTLIEKSKLTNLKIQYDELREEQQYTI